MVNRVIPLMSDTQNT